MSHRRAVVIAVSLLFVGAVPYILLGHGGDATKIHSCVAKDGTIRIVSPTTTCKSAETALDWNIVGPEGPQGVPGVNGTNGTNGADGADGMDGAPGARGPSDAFVADAGLDPQEFAVSNNEVTVATLSLPEGNYTLDAKVLVGNRDAADAQILCQLQFGISGGIDIATVRLTAGGPYTTGSIAMLPLAGSLVVGPEGQTVHIQCGSTNPGGFAQWGKLTAVKVETLTAQ